MTRKHTTIIMKTKTTDDCGNAGGYYGDQPWMYTLIGRPRREFVKLIDCKLTESMSGDYTAEIAEKIADDVAEDICDTADVDNWSEGDLRLAIGRVLLKAAENAYNEEK